MNQKTKIILDADIIIHFSKGGWLSSLPKIFPNYEYCVLETVYEEIHYPIKNQLDNQIKFLKNITYLPFAPIGDMLKEYANLINTLGKGESASMVYCKYNHGVIGSSNLKDIKKYCSENQLIYLTTIDFLYFAIKKGLMSIKEADKFIYDVVKKGSKLPDIDFNTYISKIEI